MMMDQAPKDTALLLAQIHDDMPFMETGRRGAVRLRLT